MGSRKETVKTTKYDRGSSSKMKDQEDLLLPMRQNPSTSMDVLDQPKKLKVEMTHLIISEEAKSRILDTIKFLSGEDFEAKRRTEYKDEKKNLSTQYWVDRGHLVIQGTTDYSSMKRKAMLPHEKVNIFALNQLQNYGFYQSHCTEVLRIMEGDVGKSFEMLMSRYMSYPLPDPEEVVPEDILAERSEELESLQMIFTDIFEERIANQLWIVHLDLPYLADYYANRNCNVESVKQRSDKPKSAVSSRKRPLCNFFLKGDCIKGAKCKFLHEQPKVESVKRSVVEDAHDKVRTKFDVSIRFPKGCSYPREAPLVAFCPLSNEMPSTARLRLTYYLHNFFKEEAKNQFACVYSMVDKFDSHNSQEILSIVNEKGPSPCLLDPAVPLCPDTNGKSLEDVGSDEEIDEDISIAAAFDADKARKKVIKDDEELTKQFQKKLLSPRYKTLVNSRRELPAFTKSKEILDAIERSQVVVVSGATGCGKSTQVPQYILDSWLRQRHSGSASHVEIICTQPRRLSAIGVAERVAYERMEQIGNSVGYQIRLESKMSSRTRLTFCTTGILLRRLEGDPLLAPVSHIIVDEVHERSEESDFLLLILKKLLPLRPDIRVILMSATLNAKLFCEYYDDVPVIDIPGRTFPVEQFFLEDVIEASGYVLEEYSKYTRKLNKTMLSQLESLETDLELADIITGEIITNPKTPDHSLTVKQLFYRYNGYSKGTCKSIYLMEPERINYELIESVLLWIVEGDHDFPREGSILVFLPGMQEIREMHDLLNNHSTFNPRTGRFKLIPLHSSLSSEEQAQVFSKTKAGERKIVLSTNIAETSVTIDDCVFVIDSGRMKEKRFDSNKNMESLETVWVSRANASQRRGRAGRVMPGISIHLYTHHHHEYVLTAQPVPEIQRVPLEQMLLRIKMLPSLAESTLHKTLGEIIEPPTEDSISGAIMRLFHVGALDRAQHLTPLGRHLASLPVDVRIGKLLLYGAIFCCLDSVLTMAACLSQKSPFLTPFDKKEEVNEKRKKFNIANSDHFTVLRAYNGWRVAARQSRQGGYVFANENFMSVRVLTTLVSIKGQFLDYLSAIGFVPENCRVRQKRSGDDTILDVTGPELNVNGENYKLLAGLLSASLYPNIVKVLSPEKYYAQSMAGAVPKTPKSEELKFKTKSDGYVFLHPGSVNHNIGHFASPYLVFQEKMKTSKIFIRDCTMVPVLPLVMFSGNELKVELADGTFTVSLEDGWIVFIVNNNTVGELLQNMQKELLKLMDQKIKDPSLNLNTDPKGKKIISTITYLVTNG